MLVAIVEKSLRIYWFEMTLRDDFSLLAFHTDGLNPMNGVLEDEEILLSEGLCDLKWQ
jgi:hypothetical protein